MANDPFTKRNEARATIRKLLKLVSIINPIMERRSFLNLTAAGTGALMTAPLAGFDQNSIAPELLKGIAGISKSMKNTAIAMWDYSWILRHHRYGEFENWDLVLEGLAERGYDSIRMDVMPQFVAAGTDGVIREEYRAVKKGWRPSVWGNEMTMSFRPREALLEFLPKCRKYGIKVGLATWFLRHGTDRTDIFMEEGGLLRAWKETLDFLHKNGLLDDNILYVDLLNEYPNWHGYDWLKNEMNKRSDIRQFKLDNPDANVPDVDMEEDKGNPLQQLLYNSFIRQTIQELKGIYPELDLFASLDSAMALDRIELSNFNALDYHVWFAHTGRIPGLEEVSSRDQSLDYREVNKRILTYWKENRNSLVQWIDGRISDIAATAAKNNIVCGNTEGWGPIWWFDHPELDWKWVKESAEICVDLALKHKQYRFICTSNFTHPQFKGLWEDVAWHRQITSRIKQGN